MKIKPIHPPTTPRVTVEIVSDKQQLIPATPEII
jgi:hypothetical protein